MAPWLTCRMTDDPITPAAPNPAHLRTLVATKLGRDPIEYARTLRSSTTPPMGWNRIAQIMQNATGIYITQEAVRRWVRKDDLRRASEAESESRAA